MKKTITDLPFEECKDCKTLADCPNPEVADDMMGSPLPSPLCPKPLDVMRESVKIKRLRNIKPN